MLTAEKARKLVIKAKMDADILYTVRGILKIIEANAKEGNTSHFISHDAITNELMRSGVLNKLSDLGYSITPSRNLMYVNCDPVDKAGYRIEW